jgi:hypothetical protein
MNKAKLTPSGFTMVVAIVLMTLIFVMLAIMAYVTVRRVASPSVHTADKNSGAAIDGRQELEPDKKRDWRMLVEDSRYSDAARYAAKDKKDSTSYVYGAHEAYEDSDESI